MQRERKRNGGGLVVELATVCVGSQGILIISEDDLKRVVLKLLR